MTGAIPEVASRMTMPKIIMSLGNGLKGVLPSIAGTLVVLDLGENGLDGNLPELHITNESVLFVYANDFSCMLPLLEQVELNSNVSASLALIGNHFFAPRQLPPWVTTAERPAD
eukprot:4275285-Amphidinium_carterae.1